ncbi:Bug family tripartite tricarboxylate transporter substrate binding protein [Herbaspirillum sp. GCM10030257]|uniref:Bug family tripartite tricarboxylate transporter substrate binding protein n=1 Tax=Herbaspirillum sp. GCM10030257 TaxID=3273393 RepID=UPI003608C33D
MSKRRTVLQAIALTALLATTGTVPAADWPMDRPIRMIVPTPPGGGTDIFSRVVANHLGKALGQTIVVENKGGANGLIGQTAAAKSAGDGYTILFTYTAAIAVNPALQPSMPYDTLKDLKPVAQIGSGGNYLVVASDVPAKDVKSFIEWAKQQREPVNYGSWGVGSGGHLTMEAVKMHTGIKLNHVPYRGSGPLITDLAAGTVKVAFADTVATLPYLKNGKFRALAASGSARAPMTPDVPTLSEQGVPFKLDSWYGLFVPAGTPDAVIKRLNAEVLKIVGLPEIKERFLQMNMASSPQKSPEEFEETVRKDMQAWGDIVRKNNIKVE